MKLISILCLVGLAVASPINQLKWEPGQRYTFNYHGRLLTGMPEMANHFSGLGIRCKVELSVGSGNAPGVQEFGIQVRDASYTRVNEPLHGENGSQESNNWRNLELPAFHGIPEESKRHLETPAVFKLSPRGGFVAIVVDETEPEWSVNFKKALVTLFQTQFQEGYPTEQDSDAINRIDSYPSGGDSSDRVTYWRTQEESLDGVCDVTYQVNELPAYMIREKPEMAPYKNSCPSGTQFYEVIKTKDVSSCSKRTSFSNYKPGFFNCATGNCEGMWTRSSITRYTACGSSSGQLNIQTIVNEGELQQNLFGFNTEKFLTGTRQNLTLIHQSQYGSSGHIHYPTNRLELDSLYYEYKLGSLSSGKQGPLVDQSQLDESVSSYKSLPRHILSTGTYGSKQEREEGADTSKLIPQMKRLFQQIVNEDLYNIVDIPEKQITFKGLTIARAFSLLGRSQIRSLYQELKSEFNSEDKKEMFQNVFIDTLVMGGSVSNIKFAKEMILKNELTSVQIISVFTWLPHYVIAPTEGLLESLYELVTSETIRNKPFIYNHAILSYSQLVQKACLAQNRQTSYPTYVFGNFCSPDSQVVMNRWIPYLQKELYHSGTPEHRNTIIVSLGLLSHKSVVSILVPYIENLSAGSAEYSRLTRFLAVYGLGNVGRQYPQLVSPLLYSVYSNPAETTEVRIAAFNTIMRMNPDMSVFHRIAASTWWEKDSEVLQAVNTALFTLTQQQVQSVSEVNSTLERKAWLVYPLIKKTSGTFPTSGSIYSSEYLPRLGVGYRSINSWTGAKDSLMPSDVYGRIVYFMDRFQFSPIEGALRIRGGWNLVNQLMEIINPELKMESEQEGYEQIKKQLHKEWNQVIQKLQLKARDSGMAEGAIYLNLFEDSPIFHSFQSSSSEMLKEKIMPLLKNPQRIKEIITGQPQRLNFQRMMNLAPSEFSIPSDMGFPMVVELHMPVTLSARGEMTVDTSSGGGLPSLRMNMKALYASQMTGFVGTICPFTNEFVTTGIDEHFVLNVPADITVNMNVPEHKVNIKFHAVNINKPIDIFHFHVRPYTVYQKMYDLTPMTLSSNVKFIESKEETKRRQVRFGETMGLDLQAVLTTETPYVDLRAAFQRLQMYNFNPMNFARFGWISTAQTEYGFPSFRKHEIQIKYNPGQSSTKELEIQAQVGVATKEQGKPFTFHTVKPVDQRTQAERKSIVPFKVVSKPVGEQSHQQTAQKKIKEMIEKHEVSEGQATSIRVTTVFKGTGRAAGSSSYNMNFLSGRQGLKEKWSLNVESESNNKKICVNGQLNVPQIPIWNVDSIRNSPLEFTYTNEIGFGSSCQESKIVVRGSTKSNQGQKEYSRKSQEAKQLQKLIQKGAPAVEITRAADKVRRQASILNEVDFNVHYENVPQQFRQAAEYVSEAVKSYLWPYITHSSQSTQSSGSSSVNYRIVFSPSTQTFDLYVSGPSQTVRFNHIRIPTPFSYLFPVPVARQSLLGLTKNVVGKSIYPQCTISGNWIETFDNTTTRLPLDNCYHLLSGDCSTQKRFGVLVRQQSSGSSSGSGMKQVKVYIGKTEVELIPQGSSSQQPRIMVKVNGTRTVDVDGKRGHFVNIEDAHSNVICRVMQSIDGVLVFKSTPVNVLFNGQKVKLEGSWMYKNQLCGLCGDLNGNKLADLRGPKKCVYSKPELFAASYRVPLSSHSCSPLPQHVQEQLQVETERCAKYHEIPTKVVESFKLNSGKCSSHQHQVVVRTSDICFSQFPIMECGARCKPQSIVEKSIPFTCIHKGKLSEHYAEKARSGKILPELENLPKTYSTRLPLPKTCEPVNRNL